jgi:hypothetical protein
LIFWRYGYSLHAKSSIDDIMYYDITIDHVCQILPEMANDLGQRCRAVCGILLDPINLQRPKLTLD